MIHSSWDTCIKKPPVVCQRRRSLPPPRRTGSSRGGPQYRSSDDGRRDDDTAAKEYSPPHTILPGACRRSKSGAGEITVTPMADTQLPGVFGDVQPLLEHYGYLGVGGMLFLEDFGVPVPGEIMLIAAAGFAGAGPINSGWCSESRCSRPSSATTSATSSATSAAAPWRNDSDDTYS